MLDIGPDQINNALVWLLQLVDVAHKLIWTGPPREMGGPRAKVKTGAPSIH